MDEFTEALEGNNEERKISAALALSSAISEKKAE
jgi:hypothetical protein